MTEEHVCRTTQKRTIGYIVKAWPRLSETFILNEIIAVERRGVPLRIFSVKDPDPGVAHAKVGGVRAQATYFSLLGHWRSALLANFRVLSRRPGRYGRTFWEATVRAVRSRRFAAIRRFFQAAYLADILLRQPVAHLHAHFANTPTLVAMFAHQLTGIPYTFTAHAKDIYLSRPDLLRPKVERAQAVVTCTEHNRQYLLTHVSPARDAKVHCIYHGLDLSQFKFHPTRGPDLRPPLVLSVARLVEKKGLNDLIVASDILRRRGRRFRVEIIGDGPTRESLEAQVRELGLKFHVRLLGAQPHEKVCLAYQRAFAFALPCVVAANGDRDGIPNVLLEAMASGTPVVSTTVSGIPELVESEHDGLLVPPSNPRALADALDRLLSDPGLGERLARAARAKIEESFSMDRGAARLVALFERARTNASSESGFEIVPRLERYAPRPTRHENGVSVD